VSQKDPHKGSFLLLTEYYLKFFVEKTMEEKIKHLAHAMLAEKKIMLSVLGLLVVLGGGAAAFMLPGNDWKDSLAAVAAAESHTETSILKLLSQGVRVQTSFFSAIHGPQNLSRSEACLSSRRARELSFRGMSI
jgi:hypothetical protein